VAAAVNVAVLILTTLTAVAKKTLNGARAPFPKENRAFFQNTDEADIRLRRSA
jgi:hypothetical protein